MTVALDTSALLAIALDGPERPVVLAALDADPVWSASALALAEAISAIDRLIDEPVRRMDAEDGVRRAWDHVHVVPVDQRCLDAAVDIARLHLTRLTHALHLAAALRVPRPVTFVTFDAAQIGLGLALDLDVVSR